MSLYRITLRLRSGEEVCTHVADMSAEAAVLQVQRECFDGERVVAVERAA